MLRHPTFAGSGGCRFEVLRQLRCRMHVHLQLLHFDEQLRDLHHKVCRRDGKGMRTWATRMPKKKKLLPWNPTSVGDAPDTLRTHTENTYIHIITHTHIL